MADSEDETIKALYDKRKPREQVKIPPQQVMSKFLHQPFAVYVGDKNAMSILCKALWTLPNGNAINLLYILTIFCRLQEERFSHKSKKVSICPDTASQ